MTALPHPILVKAATSFGEDASDDNYVRPIASSKSLPLLEIKAGQWRCGVWADDDLNVCWVLVAGLAKGDHEDHDDFYKRVARESADPSRWMPTDVDVRLLKRERAASLLSEWELATQQQVADGLHSVCAGGTARFELPHPVRRHGTLATVEMSVVVVRDASYQADEIVVDIVPNARHAGSNVFWQATVRVLTTLSPPQQGWDRYKDSYSNIAEPGRWSERVTELGELVERGALAESEPGQVAHYSHREHIAGSVVQGTAMRALCGIFFVNTQIPDDLPQCPQCTERWQQLPAANT
ncbi:DUF3039 domain-containing protein [Gordonia amicalis]|uniref:DUF3039 domain-containing protein n=1 Tax=Gordonia amicalis TaxID=89053 RepID=UPI003A7F8A1E